MVFLSIFQSCNWQFDTWDLPNGYLVIFIMVVKENLRIFGSNIMFTVHEKQYI